MQKSLRVIVMMGAACLVSDSALLAAEAVLPGYLTDPTVMRSQLQEDGSYQPQERFKYPFLSTYYVKPIVGVDEEVEINFFVTDFESSKIRFFDDSHRFAAFLELRKTGSADWRRFVLKKLHSGDHAFKLGKLAAGEYEMRIWAIDRQLRESHRVLHDFRVGKPLPPSVAETYVMTKADLGKYGIRNDGNLATIVWEGSNETKTVRTKNPARPGYTVHVPMQGGKPVFKSYETARIVFDSGYDAEAVEKESVANAEGLQRLIDEKAASGIRRLVLLPGTYRISATRVVRLANNLTLDLNGATLKQNAFAGCSSVVISLSNVKDARLTNGTIEGDYYEHDYKGSPGDPEHPVGYCISGDSTYCSVDNLKVVDITGYGASIGLCKDKRLGYAYCYEGLGKYQSGGLDPKTGLLDPGDTARFTTDYRSLAKVAGLGRIQISRYLGYQGVATRSWQMTVCWYDADKKFISSETCWQYREMFIPAKAAYLRVSIEESDVESANKCGLVLTRFRYPKNCVVRDCAFERCRCVGHAASQMKNMLFEGNYFTACGERAAKCPFDAEDGWDQMQDVTFRRNKMRGNPKINSIVICCGHSFVFEQNDCGIHFWGRCHSPCVRNNNLTAADVTCDTRLRSGYGRFEGNRFGGKVVFGRSDAKRRNDNWDFVAKGIVFDGSGEDGVSEVITGDGGRLVDCTLKNVKTGVGSAIGCRFENCTGKLPPNAKWMNVTMSGGALANVSTTCRFSDCTFDNVKFDNFSAFRGEICRAEFLGCAFRGGALTKFGCGASLAFDKCRFADFSVGAFNRRVASNLRFSDCKIGTPAQGPFLSSEVFVVGDISFDGCSVTGVSPLVTIVDTRSNTISDDTGRLSVSNTVCGVSVPFALVREGGKYDSARKLILTEANNTYANGTAFADGSSLPASWTVEGFQKKGKK